MDRDLGFRAGTIWSFERVSAAVQAEGRGLVRQGNRAADWCARHGLELADERLLSDPGRSAYHGKHLRRGGPLDVFMELAERELLGPDPVLLVEAIDRLSRLKARQALEAVFLRLINAGVTIVTLMDGQFYNRERCDADGTALVMLTLKCQAAHEYSLHLADRQRDNWSAVRGELKQGVVKRRRQFAPSWLDWDETTQTWQFNAKAASVLRAMTLLREHGLSHVSKVLNDEGLPTLGRSKRWTASNLSSLVRNAHQIWGGVAIRPEGAWKPLERGPLGEIRKSNGDLYDPRAGQSRVRGALREDREICDGAFPSLMSQREVEEVLALVSSRHRGQQHPGPLTQLHWIGRGLTRCACGGSMSTCKGGQPHRPIRYVACRERHNSERCRRPFLPMEGVLAVLLSRLTLQELSQLNGTVDLGQEQSRLRHRIDELLGEQELMKEQIANLQGSLAAAAELGPEAFAAAAEALTRRITERRSQLEAVTEELAQTRAELSRCDSPLALETVERVIEPLKAALLSGKATRDERYQVNAALRQIGLMIHLDSEAMQMGLQLSGGAIEWQPIDFELALEMLAAGTSDVSYATSGSEIVAAG